MAIKVQNVTKLFGKQKALDNVSFEVPKGQVVGFLGPNGAGKSTMMKIITGFIQPTSGNVAVNGIAISNESREYRNNIGYMPENNPLYTEMYVKEYLHFVAKVYGLGRYGSKRIKDLIELTGIGYEQNKMIGELSRGYRQRVGLAQALLNRPSVLILDEPTSGLDPNQIVEIRKIIADVGKEKTVLLSTHIMQEVEAICSRVVILNKGVIVADGLTSDVMQHGNLDQQAVSIEVTSPITAEVLSKIDGVQLVDRVSNDGCQWIIKSSSKEDIRPAIFNFCAQNGITLITLNQKSIHMEEVFHSLTQFQ
ncbi:MAG: ATP-binding cassette domain-containing protein [Tenuifilaceae bacterium]|jgi:ABC-2 type transport system ATP-binding protein|uniref:ATP-binding cassette domain-containing protein n=1 Tax=Perlabentimonas gracilis TaxID=2715279 RepID=UPI0014092A11|nr:ATP-binding cassette domain-containing protein [Perlabentimonas gracilis]MDX9769929.1 ATP-binding cassette domain-containing protein [Tenuifilaceae bacterium]NHB68991.1 ATP-binding cassette domain-containing protein [Perlabentimonas gracilis]